MTDPPPQVRRMVEEQDRDVQFHLRDVSFGGGGLSPEFAEGGWQRVRDATYEGHGAWASPAWWRGGPQVPQADA